MFEGVGGGEGPLQPVPRGAFGGGQLAGKVIGQFVILLCGDGEQDVLLAVERGEDAAEGDFRLLRDAAQGGVLLAGIGEQLAGGRKDAVPGALFLRVPLRRHHAPVR